MVLTCMYPKLVAEQPLIRLAFFLCRYSRAIVIQLQQDVTYLSEVIVSPFPTEEVFKEALLALNIPTDDQSIDRKSINQELLLLMLKTTPMDGQANQQYYLSQMSAAQGSQYMPVTNPLFNVFNWAKFFRSLKQNKK